MARNILTTTMLTNTKRDGITAAAGTILALVLIRSVVYSVINYPGSQLPRILNNPQNKK